MAARVRIPLGVLRRTWSQHSPSWSVPLFSFHRVLPAMQQCGVARGAAAERPEWILSVRSKSMHPTIPSQRKRGRDWRVDSVLLGRPREELLASYAAALKRDPGFSPRPAREQLIAIERDPKAFLYELCASAPTSDALGALHRLLFWLSDGEFCGELVVRWRQGTNTLDQPTFGHVGYGVVAWKRRRGYATAGLGLLIARLRCSGEVPLTYLDITTSRDNIASQKVITANGGELVDSWESSPSHAGAPALGYRIALVAQ